MIFIVLKDRNTKEEIKVEMSFEEFFSNTPQFKGISLKKAHEHFYKSPMESDHLIISLNSDDFTINFSNLPLKNVFNLNYEISEGKNLFDIYTTFKLIKFDEILSNLEVGSSRKFDYFIFYNDELIHYYILSVYRDVNSILFSSSKNISYEMFRNKQRSLNSSDEGIIIIENDSILYVNEVTERLFLKNKKEFYKLKLNDFLNLFSEDSEFKKAIWDIKKGYSISQTLDLKEEINGINRHFKVFCSTYLYKSNPSIHIRIIDMESSDLAKEINFKTQNDLQVLRSFANIVAFVQDNSTNQMYWSSEVGSVLGMFPSCVSLQEDLFKYIVPKDKSNFEDKWVESIASKRDIVTEFTICNSENELKHLYLFAKLIYSPEGEIIKIKGIIQDISQIVDYKNKYESTKNVKSIPLKRFYSNSSAIARGMLDIIKREFKINEDYLETLEKTQNRIFAIKLAYQMLANSSKFKINLKTYFDRYIKAVHKFYDIDHVDLDWNISREFVSPKLISIVAFVVNEILSEILKYTSPQVIETIRFNIFKDEECINLIAWTDLIFYNAEEIENEFVILKYALNKYNFTNYKIEVTDEGTFFNIKFI